MAEKSEPEEVAEQLSDSEEGSETTSLQADDSDLALQGIGLLLNNDWDQASALFNKYKNDSPVMCSGASFVAFLQAIMTFEEEKLQEAMKALQETEKRCESNDGFMKVMKRKIKKKSKNEEFVLVNFNKCVNVEDRLQRHIVQADCLLYQAVLTFIGQDLSSYIKGGWLLRKAWKIYEKTHKEISVMYNTRRASNSSKTASLVGNSDEISSNVSNGSIEKVDSNENEVPEEVVARLFGSVNFGYGTFQLCISMVPPKLLKIIEFLGFEGDEKVGLQGLEFASLSRDMKAPLATLGLLWYHTIIRPFFALDGNSVDAGVEEALSIIERSEKEYPKSALFLFFKGRIQRLQCKLDESLATYRLALESCKGQREMQLICLHELGWLSMMQLNWQEAHRCFVQLKEESRWSKSYYTYLTGLCQAILGDVKGGLLHFKDIPKLIRKKNNQIEAFVLRRSDKFKKTPLTVEHATLLAYEVLYLWNAFATCSKETLETMISECGKQTNKNVFHLQSLVEGAIYRELGDAEMSSQCFEEAIARHSGMKEDYHVAAFALYELGVMMSKDPVNHKKGKKLLHQAKDNFKDYDFENRLNVRIHAALKRTDAEGTPV